MTIKILAVGSIKESYLKDGIKENIKKLKTKFNIELIEINEHRLGNTPSQAEINNALKIEASKITKYLDNSDYTIICDIDGKIISSKKLKKGLTSQLYNYKRNVVFIIGSSFGIDQDLKRKTNLKLSFSKMTFPHQLMRLLLVNHLATILL